MSRLSLLMQLDTLVSQQPLEDVLIQYTALKAEHHENIYWLGMLNQWLLQVARSHQAPVKELKQTVEANNVPKDHRATLRVFLAHHFATEHDYPAAWKQFRSLNHERQEPVSTSVEVLSSQLYAVRRYLTKEAFMRFRASGSEIVPGLVIVSSQLEIAQKVAMLLNEVGVLTQTALTPLHDWLAEQPKDADAARWLPTLTPEVLSHQAKNAENALLGTQQSIWLEPELLTCLGRLALHFPCMPILFCESEPLHTALGAFTSDNALKHPSRFDQAALGRQMALSEALSKHYAFTLSNPIQRVRLETLWERPEAVLNGLCKWLKQPLPYIETLPAYASMDSISTLVEPLAPHLGEWKASYQQTRQSIAQSTHISVKRQMSDKPAEALFAQAREELAFGDAPAARKTLETLLVNHPENTSARVLLGRVMMDQGQVRSGLTELDAAEPHVTPAQRIQLWSLKGEALMRLTRLEESLGYYQAVVKHSTSDYAAQANLGNVYRMLGQFKKSENTFKHLIKRDRHRIGSFSNYISSLHYDPSKTQHDIFKLLKQWDIHYAPKRVTRQSTQDSDPERRLRVGMISAGLHSHPVGQMIVKALEHISAEQVEWIAYRTKAIEDRISQRLKACCSQWHNVMALDETELASRIRQDNIDILIDLCGHSEGYRLGTIAREPAPLIVKWVGGLINTTGPSAIDYLISDSIETPPGIDDYYIENLIRLPDDYICYDPPIYTPKVNPLPALENGYITFGCFNNPSKINPDTIRCWGSILQALPDSRMLLKSGQYADESFAEHVYRLFANEGIEREHVILEGGVPHADLLATYNRIDIALDPWPYSGGLTTCEALLMGVPVVTLPGPTFAGRHSATHLVNAGMPELVVDSWVEYRERVLELASDLESLNTIRQHLRDVLIQSPVCDGPRFAKHLTQALRAIWQRYCEGKAPEALTFNKEGVLWFEDDKTPLTISVQEKNKVVEAAAKETFSWHLQGKLIGVDNGARMAVQPAVQEILKHQALELITFDPAGALNHHAAKEMEGLHHYPSALLGNGEMATLYATLDPAHTATLPPLENASNVLTKLPVSTLPLDGIEGLPSLDWLILDARHDASAILEGGINALGNTLLLDITVAFQPTHERQLSLAELQHWASCNGFRFYRLNTPRYISYLPKSVPAEKRQATELASADVLFLPNHERMATLTYNQRTKLAFLLHTVYGIKDMAYELLVEVDEEKAKRYLIEEKLIAPEPESASSDSEEAKLSDIEEKSEFPLPDAPHMSPSANNKRKTETVSGDIDNLLGETEVLISEPAIPEKPLAASQTAVAKSREPKSRKLWELDEPIHVVDVGANPIDGTPPYAGLLKRGMVRLVGFEPQTDALQKLQAMKGPNETYLPHAVGTGEKTKLFICQASGMTSTLKPNNEVLNHFQGYPIWGKVKAVEEINTVRLDDVEEIEEIDWLKIDIQGGELNVFENAEEKLKNTLIIQTEVNFIQLYENQPLFAEIDQWMRRHGFMLHTLLEQRKRLYAPMKINGGIHQGINQLTTADAVYVRDINSSPLSTEQCKKIAFILSKAYGSHDLAYRFLMREKSFKKKDFFKKVVGQQINAISVD